MKTILVVDDEQDIVRLLKYNLQKEGYAVLAARTGKQAIEQARQLPHLILLDVMMPEMDGLDVLKALRKDRTTAHIPIIFLTAKGSEVDQVLGLELGADDYIVKPVSIPVLLARVKNVLRKNEAVRAADQPGRAVTRGAVTINPAKHLVTVDGKEIFFPKKEFEVLLHLAEHAGEVVTRDSLLRTIWGSDVQVVDRTIDVHIRKIREKLGAHAAAIETIKGIGYRMREED